MTHLNTPAEVFASKTERIDSGCIVWIGGLTAAGYGKFYTQGKGVLAHRWSYQATRGDVPEGLELDHLCRNRACVNPDHLEAVTRQVNATRGVGFAGINARKTNCPQGHPYSGDDFYVNSAGGRVCRTCDRAKALRYKARKKATR